MDIQLRDLINVTDASERRKVDANKLLLGFTPDFTDITKQGDNALLGVSSNEQKVFTRV